MNWTQLSPKIQFFLQEAAQQTNSYDCGIFTMEFMRFVSSVSIPNDYYCLWIFNNFIARSLKSITIMIIEDDKQAELMTSALQTKV